jgi:hypothetical protein
MAEHVAAGSAAAHTTSQRDVQAMTAMLVAICRSAQMAAGAVPSVPSTQQRHTGATQGRNYPGYKRTRGRSGRPKGGRNGEAPAPGPLPRPPAPTSWQRGAATRD